VSTTLREVGQFVVVGDQRTTPHLSVIDTRNWQITARVGDHGSGAGQMMDANSVGEVVGDTMAVWAFDTRLHRFTEVSIDATGQARINRQVVLPVAMHPQTLQVAHQVGGVFTSGWYGDAVLYRIDSTHNTRSTIAVALPYDSTVAARVSTRQELNMRSLAVAPRSGRMVLAYQYASRLDFFGPKGEYELTVTGPRMPRVHFDLVTPTAPFKWFDDTELAYVAVAATERFVYALYCGCTKKSRAFAPYVEVFTWDGAFVRELVLDVPIFRLAALSGDTLVLGATWDPYPSIGVWKIPKPE
jgi:hypothetical protein